MNNEFIDPRYIQQLIAGDGSAFDIVYKLYAEKVYRLAFRFLKDSEQSKEIVQETFIRLWLNKEKLSTDGNLWLYLFVIAKRLSINSLKQICKSTDLVEKLFYEVGEQHNNTEEDVFLRDLEQYTDKVIATLPRQQQLVYMLSRNKGLSHKEIADQLHISPSTVNNHIVEALKTLKAQLKYADFIYVLLLFINF